MDNNLSVVLNDSRCDLGNNSKILLDLVSNFSNARFMDLGVRHGHSSIIMSIGSEKNNNQVCGCDINFDYFNSWGSNYVNKNYICYLADSVTLGKNWDEKSFDIIFVDTIHTREQVLAELYYWSNHINENGYFVFHDSHWTKSGGDIINGVEHRRVDEAITEYFDLPKNVMELDVYQNDDIELHHYEESHGMTFVKVKNLKTLKGLNKKIDWKEVFQMRNELNNLFFNETTIQDIENELVIDFNPEVKNESI
jgi:predicted O-methyltransferase YrrM